MTDTDDCPPSGIERPYIPIEVLYVDANVAVHKETNSQVDWVKFDRAFTDDELATMNTSPLWAYERVPDHADELYCWRKG